MSRFAIFVTVKLKPGTAEEFEPIILENATAAMRDEPECHEFHVMKNNEDPDTYHFFEVYSAPSSLDAHRETAHYKKFVSRTGDMVTEKHIQRVTMLNH